MTSVDQEPTGAILDIEARLRSASEILGSVANMIELSLDLGEINEESAEWLDVIAARLTLQAEYVRDQFTVNEEIDIDAPSNPETPEINLVQVVSNNDIDAHSVEMDHQDEVESVVEGENRVDAKNLIPEGFNYNEQRVLRRLLQNPGTKFFPRDLSYMLGGDATKSATAQRFRTFIKRVEDSPLGDRLKVSGTTTRRQYWFDPIEPMTEPGTKTISELESETATELNLSSTKLTDWGLELHNDNSLHFEGKKISLRDEAVEVVKLLIGYGKTISYEDLFDLISGINQTIDDEKLIGILHELKNAFEGYMSADYWHDKTIREGAELTRYITIKGKNSGVLHDFLDRVPVNG